MNPEPDMSLAQHDPNSIGIRLDFRLSEVGNLAIVTGTLL